VHWDALCPQPLRHLRRLRPQMCAGHELSDDKQMWTFALRHGLMCASKVLTTTPREIFASGDGGENWAPLGVNGRFRLPYCRQLTQKIDDPKTLFVATGDGAAGHAGGIQRTRDGGERWEMLTLPVEPNSPIWGFAVHPANPERIVACSHYGELFASENAGDTWAKLPREFSEIRAVTWVPN
jgi:photosystem II stability/assembly factor-like uncharacterized protein